MAASKTTPNQPGQTFAPPKR